MAEPVLPVSAARTAVDATQAVEKVLAAFVGAQVRRARETDAVFARDVAGRVAAFALRGGKRLRTGFAWCGWRAAGGTRGASDVLRIGAALELVQACALIHDDVMDGSQLRRGAPAVHVEFARQHRAAAMIGPRDSFATSAAVLAGDLALAWADDLLAQTAFGSPYGRGLHGEWQAMRAEMVAGQYRDIHAEQSGASGLDEAVTIATLKSALYTVERPLALGAALAGADDATLDALRSAGRCAGLAFQLRDDLLGAFGDPAATGKPAGEDLRTRKLTYLLAVALVLADAAGDGAAADALAPRATDLEPADVEQMRRALLRTGAPQLVEAKIGELAKKSIGYFDETRADPSVRQQFAAFVERATGPVLRAREGQ
nr:polyprenyl synthetase family protein [Streptomyces polyasparticus]